MNRCHLKGSQGDALHAVLCAAGYGIRWILQMNAKKGQGLLLCLLRAACLAALLARSIAIRLSNSAHSSDQNCALA